jgi:hypothetical protein
MASDLRYLCARIVDIVRAQRVALCVKCLTGLMANEAGADELDIRVAVVHLSLSPGFASSDTCGGCDLPAERRNPVVQATTTRSRRSLSERVRRCALDRRPSGRLLCRADDDGLGLIRDVERCPPVLWADLAARCRPRPSRS